MMTSYINRLIYQSEYIFLIARADRASQLQLVPPQFTWSARLQALSPPRVCSVLSLEDARHIKSWNVIKLVGFAEKNMWNIVEFQSMARPCCRITWLQPLMILSFGYESRELSWSFWEGSPHDLVHAKRIPGRKQVLAVARKYSGIYTPIWSYLHG